MSRIPRDNNESENYWETVGSDMDKLLNPDKYTEEDKDRHNGE